MDPRAIAIATFDLHSEQYARYRPHYPEALFAWLESLCPVKQWAWDCATGTGQTACRLGQSFARVDATDINPNQLAAAEPHPRVFYRECPAEQTPFDDEVFELVTVAQSLHWFDYPRFWPELERVLKPGGVFAAWGYDWFSVTPEIDQAAKVYLSIVRPFWSSCSRLLWDGYREVGCHLPAVHPPQFVISMQWDLSQLLGYLRTWSATKLCMQSLGSGVLDDAQDQIMRAWGSPLLIRQVTMPLHVIAGRKPL
ncbi:MAG TPA: class I SAM-dependent methyltransferase [Chromobacteriaceae bacterium]|nr:class I SAM-dependent methyltransferase [Chromobacteriaceae bacterium]